MKRFFLLLALLEAASFGMPRILEDSISFGVWNQYQNQWGAPSFFIKWTSNTDYRIRLTAISPAAYLGPDTTFYRGGATWPVDRFDASWSGAVPLPWWSESVKTVKIRVFIADNIKSSTNSDTLIDTLSFAVPASPFIGIERAPLSVQGPAACVKYYSDVRGRKFKSLAGLPGGVYFERGEKFRKIIIRR